MRQLLFSNECYGYQCFYKKLIKKISMFENMLDAYCVGLRAFPCSSHSQAARVPEVLSYRVIELDFQKHSIF